MHKFANISEADLERLYELKYKHSWLSVIEREYGNLPTDVAYLKKAQIEDELYPLIEKMMDEFLEICSGWLEWHDISSYDRLNEMVDEALMELTTIPEYGEAIEYNSGDTAENLQWFEEIVNEIPEAQAKDLVQNILNYYNQELLPALTRVENAKDALEEAKNQGIKEKLNSLELAITTAHQNGELGEIVLGTPAAKAKQVFDDLASDKRVPQWDREISSWVGYSIGTLALAQLSTVISALAAIQMQNASAASIALDIADELEAIADYWTAPSYKKEEDDGVEFSWPNGTFIALVKSLGRWYLETEDDIYLLINTRTQDIAREIDLILKAKGYDEKLKVDYSAQQPLSF
jgi:hypothetical protein